MMPRAARLGHSMRRLLSCLIPAALAAVTLPARAIAQAAGGGEADLRVPDLSTVSFFGIPGHTLLLYGLIFCGLGLLFGLVSYSQLKRLPVHEAMREVSELIYATCKAYLIQQGRFLMLLELFIGVVIVLYFGLLRHYAASMVLVILAFNLAGGSFWPPRDRAKMWSICP